VLLDKGINVIDETIVLLTYYYNEEDISLPLYKYLRGRYLGAYLPFDIYLLKPLKEIFSKVVLYDYLKRRAEIGIDSMNSEIIELINKERPKYVLWTSFYYDVKESTLDAIRKSGTKLIGIYFDDEWRFDSYSKYWIPYLDFCVTNSQEAVKNTKVLMLM